MLITIKYKLYDEYVTCSNYFQGYYYGLSIEQDEANAIPLKRVANAQEIADVVLFLLSEKSSFMTGSLVPVDGGYTAK
jgi:NAD(P)-dependent dehydrogenase (short-subunit alcohol dehydrogenase family)